MANPKEVNHLSSEEVAICALFSDEELGFLDKDMYTRNVHEHTMNTNNCVEASVTDDINIITEIVQQFQPIKQDSRLSSPVTGTDFTLNYDGQPSHLMWMQGKQQAHVTRSISSSFGAVPEDEFTSGHIFTSSSTSESSADVNILSTNVNKCCTLKMPYLGPTDRDIRNRKSRERNDRISVICKKMRQIIPGMTETEDRATVFEQGAAYINFLVEKMGRRYDHIFVEKINFKTSVMKSP